MVLWESSIFPSTSVATSTMSILNVSESLTKDVSYSIIVLIVVDDFIPEEFEKNTRNILPWKIKWVKDLVKNK